ncbi:SDR family oxidoreductase [Andreprevotia chitinilytica]|uniref:SDR family oxidoreductase n=1 Tax=Andreprevotia chitinilytica TaxID=396808 RepID=UPI000A007886|nr:SDR family oxidoreductase [Andreprevotia chitinilytica]
MNLNLTNQVAIVTGASRGIGRAIAELLSQEGMRLVLAARSEADLKHVAESCKTETVIFPADLRDEKNPQLLIDFAISQFGQIDLLVNNAGATKRGDFLQLSEDDWQDGFALKFYSAVRCIRAAWPHLSKSQGSVVNIVGIGGRTGSADFAIGGAVNAGLLNLTKVLADKGITDGVKVNAINPGYIATDRLKSRITALAAEKGISADQAALELADSLGVKRFGNPAEIAAAVAFLASGVSGYCQGTILDADGGRTRTL